jgi:hypothetical protein
MPSSGLISASTSKSDVNAAAAAAAGVALHIYIHINIDAVDSSTLIADTIVIYSRFIIYRYRHGGGCFIAHDYYNIYSLSKQ